MNPYLVFVISVLLASALLETLVAWLNLKASSDELPEAFAEVFDAERYAQSQAYLRARTRFGFITDGIETPALLAFILLGGFGLVDAWARSLGFSSIPTGLIFAGVLVGGSSILGLPFSVYRTFRIEAQFGFNRTTPKTFVLDLFKGLVLTALLGGPLLAGVLWIFDWLGPWAWLCAWGLITVVQWVMGFLAPVLIMPLFSKFTPIKEGSLKDGIESLARAQNFKLKGVFTMDGSKRSAKANAFFTGFGRFRRVVLYDTLIEKHTEPEILGVLAHEFGHFKKKHILTGQILGTLTTGFMFYLLALFLNDPRLTQAFGIADASIYASLVVFGFVFAPVSLILGVATAALSRHHERQADAFAAQATGKPADLAAALKRLSADNLSNLTPHRLEVILHHGHPPVLERVERLQAMAAKAPAP